MKLAKNILNYLIKNSRFLFIILLALVVLESLNTFLMFSVKYTDSDQTLIWQVSKDLMNGSFHGPCFYGQSYNPIFEPLFALPFLFCGMGFYSALPLTTTLLGIIPFLILSFYLYKKIDALTGLLPLFLYLLLPPEYSMLTSISRGFVAGIFFAILGFVLFVFHKSSSSKFISGIFFGLGIYANPSCILLFPLLLPFLYHERKDLFRILMPLVFGLLIGTAPIVFNNVYYYYHSDMVIFGSPNYDISFTSFFKVMGKLDNYFDFITPLIWRSGWISLFFFVFIGIRLWKYNRKVEFFSVFFLFVFILFSFFVAKVTDATNSVFFSGSRMFLAYPFIFLFIFIYFLNTLSILQKRNVYFILIILVFAIFPIKLFAFNLFLKNALNKNSIVNVISVDKLRNTCKDVLNFADGKIDLIIANSSDTPDQPITYGCPCLIKNFPTTVQPLFERRTWLMPVILNRPYKRILIHGKDTTIWNRMHFEKLHILKRNIQNGWLLIENKLVIRNLLIESEIKPYK